VSRAGRLYDVVAFDAMGVLYRSRDDVAELLVPYARAKGSALDAGKIELLYTECSLGRFTSADLWRYLGAAGADDVEYCSGHRLTDGVPDLLAELRSTGTRLACLSNDVSEWSAILRARFGLETWITTWVISGDIGVRKPAPEAYLSLCQGVNAGAARVLFIDDRLANVRAARQAGLAAVWFGPDAAAGGADVPTAADIATLAEMVTRWT
jgi:putative hydrolase of the HAD superfamily